MDIVALKVFAIVAAIFLASGAITLAIVNPNISGFAGLVFGNLFGSGEKNSNAQHGAQGADNGFANAAKDADGNSSSGGISSSLSYEVIGFTKLDANLSAEREIPECPNTADVAVKVRNSGKYAAEKIGISANSGFVVMACDGCSIESLGSGAEKTINMKLCRSSGQELKIAVSAVNANPIELKTNDAE